jgi:hypothetical protein
MLLSSKLWTATWFTLRFYGQYASFQFTRPAPQHGNRIAKAGDGSVHRLGVVLVERIIPGLYMKLLKTVHGANRRTGSSGLVAVRHSARGHALPFFPGTLGNNVSSPGLVSIPGTGSDPKDILIRPPSLVKACPMVVHPVL